MALPNICDDLAALSCTTGRHSDGTGTLQRIPRAQISNEAILLKFSKDLRKQIQIRLDKPAGRGLKEFCRAHSIHEDALIQAVKTVLRDGNPGVPGKLEAHPYFQTLVGELRLEISKHLTDPKKKVRLHKVIFRDLKLLLEQRIARLPIEAVQKGAMIKKIRSVTLDPHGTCFSQGRPILFRTTARYESETNSIRVCDGNLTENYSEFKLAHSLGHELSHSIDPCSLDLSDPSHDLKSMEESYPIKGLIACLRSEKSIMAKSSPAESPVGVSGSTSRPVYDFCQNDQIVESFADWLSAEVLTEYISKNFQLTKTQWQTGFTNIFRFNCDDPAGSDDDIHPSLEYRMNRLLLTQPAVRKKMGCETPAKFEYCQVQP